MRLPDFRTACCAFVLAGCLAAQTGPATRTREPADATAGAAAPPSPIDFAKVDRTPPRLPPVSVAARYGIYLFGLNGQTRIFAVLDKEKAEGPYDVLYFDLDGNGDLTAPGERFAGKPDEKGERCVFTIGDYRPPHGDAVHKDFRITWTADSGVRFSMLWRGEKRSFGDYGPTRESYAGFGDSLQSAPVFVPGWDRPFQFERWIDEPLQRGGDTDFKVFVGNRGDRTGTFTAVDDKFLPAGEYALATLIYEDQSGKQRTQTFELRQRC
jgi:hypothetical protein